MLSHIKRVFTVIEQQYWYSYGSKDTKTNFIGGMSTFDVQVASIDLWVSST